MSLNYKTDHSFFTTITPPFSFYGPIVKNWLMSNQIPKYRYIRDRECERNFLNIQKVQDFYPGIKTIGVVVDPWKRVDYAYSKFLELQNVDNEFYQDYKLKLENFNLGSFRDFVLGLEQIPEDTNFWFHITTPQVDWLESESSKVDYVLRAETIEEDFKQIQEYFSTFEPLEIVSSYPGTKENYDDDTKEVVSRIFAKDIETYEYVF